MPEQDTCKAENAKEKPDALPLLKLSPLSSNLAIEGSNSKSLTPKCLNFSPFWMQVLGATGPTVSVLSSGMTAGYSGILLPQLNTTDSSIILTQENSSWIASTAVFAMAVGCILISLLMDKFGRRRSLQVLSVPAAIGWIILSVSNNVYMLYVGRFLTGLYVGLSTPVSTVFIAETSAPKYRGFLLAASNLGIPVGIFVTHLLGAVTSWRTVALISATLPIVCLLLMLPVPETPLYLLAEGHVSQAKNSFDWYRGNGNDATREFRQLVVKHEDQSSEDKGRSGKTASGLKIKWKNLLKMSFLKPLIVLLFFFFVQQFSGINAIVFYTVSIMQEIGAGMDEYLATIVLDGMRILVCVLSCWLLRHCGRRPLAIFSAVSTAVTLILLGVYFCFSDSLGKETNMKWIPLLLLNLYIWTTGVGLVPLPWIMSGEVFPSSTRAFGSGMSSCFGFVVFFAVVQTGPAILASLGTAYTFIIYGIISFLGSIFLFIFLPETKNKTLQQIEENRED